ncbi:MAG: lipoyl synthase [Planctomycetes bacterium]|nr:lipoyl synthase [Planctomycetota bacterium]
MEPWTVTSRSLTPFPPWLRKRISARGEAEAVRRLLAELGLATVCSGARCPNLPECFARGTATFLILGSSCTRSCRFCAIEKRPPGPPRGDEPEAVAEASARLNLRHVVITSVTRDDLADGGAGHFARTIRAVRARLPQAAIEVLTPDFRGDEAAIDAVLLARPDIFNHNVETVPRLYPSVRPEADYRRSLGVLAHAKAWASRQAGPEARSAAGGTPAGAAAAAGHGTAGPATVFHTKSGLMLGLGETPDEVRAVLGDLRGAGCDIVTIGQYLSPSPAHQPAARFAAPEEFAAWQAEARALGFAAVASGPFVRSSYQAESVFAGRENR